MSFSFRHKVLLIGFALTVFLMTYDMLFDMLLHLLHTLFEMVEYTLDELIEHEFHADRHTAQVITVYILFLIALFLCYRIYRLLPAVWLRVEAYFEECWLSCKVECQNYWYERTAWEKMQWYMAFALTILAGLGYLFFL